MRGRFQDFVTIGTYLPFPSYEEEGPRKRLTAAGVGGGYGRAIGISGRIHKMYYGQGLV